VLFKTCRQFRQLFHLHLMAISLQRTICFVFNLTLARIGPGVAEWVAYNKRQNNAHILVTRLPRKHQEMTKTGVQQPCYHLVESTYLLNYCVRAFTNTTQDSTLPTTCSKLPRNKIMVNNVRLFSCAFSFGSQQQSHTGA